MALTEALDHSKRAMFQGRDVPWLLDQWAETTPENCFLSWVPFSGEERDWSYRDFRKDAKALAGALHKRGIRKGDKVLIHLENCPEFLISWFACAYLGAVAVTTNTRSVARDMTYFAEHADVVCAITQPAFASLLSEAVQDVRFLVVTDNNSGDPDEVAANISYIPFAGMLSEASPCPDRDCDHLADLVIQYLGHNLTPKSRAVDPRQRRLGCDDERQPYASRPAR